jgi:histidinol phosphatase-like enzyme
MFDEKHFDKGKWCLYAVSDYSGEFYFQKSFKTIDSAISNIKYCLDSLSNLNDRASPKISLWINFLEKGKVVLKSKSFVICVFDNRNEAKENLI